MWGLTTTLAALGGFYFGGMAGSVLGVAGGFSAGYFLGAGTIESYSKYLTKRALKQKRLELGLPAKPEKPEMLFVEEYTLPESPDRLKDVLSNSGLKKKFGRRKFVNEKGDVIVDYTPCNTYAPFSFMCLLEETSVEVRAPKRETAEPVLSVIESLIPKPPEPDPQFQEIEDIAEKKKIKHIRGT